MTATHGPIRSEDMNYGLDDVPKPLAAAGLGLQHVLTMFGATVAVPLILGPAMEMDPGQLAILVSAVMISAGLSTIIQVRFGSRLPIIQGMSFAFLGPFFAIIGATAAQGAPVSMQFIAGAILAGAVVEMLLGYSTLFGRLRHFISPVVIGPVIMLIGLALFQVGAPQAGQNWLLGATVIAAAFLFSLILAPKVRFFSLFPILLAVLSGYLLALLLSVTGVFSPDTAGYVSFDPVAQAPWVRDPTSLIFPWGLPQFAAGFILSTFAAYLASMIESFGDYFAISRAAGAGDPTSAQVNRGIGAEGIGCAIAALFGGFANTSYTENIGLVALTKVASRVVVYVAGGFLITLGLIAKFGAVIATIPQPVIGGLYCTLFGLISAVGISNAARADLSSQRNLLIMGFCLFMGLSVPAYFAQFENGAVQVAGAQWLGDMINTVGSTGMAVAAIFGLILDNVVPGSARERGLDETPVLTTTEASELPEVGRE